MKKKDDLTYKLKRISELMGDKAVFRIGVDIENKRIDLLSVDAYISEEDKVARDKKAIIEIPEYIG